MSENMASWLRRRRAIEALTEMSDEFTVESKGADAIEVRHIGEGHLYRFPIVEGQRVRHKLADGPRSENQNAKRESVFFAIQARIFAEREARKAGLID